MESKEQRDAAEGDLIDLIRRNDAQNFRVAITCVDGRWHIAINDHDAPQTEPRSDRLVGAGATFTEAWTNLQPTWATEI